MKIHRSYRDLPEAARGCVVAIGNFDGVHRGHKALIEAARNQAETLGAELGIVTFEPHPLQMLRPDIAPRRLTSLRTKAELLAMIGVKRLFALTFDQSMRGKSPEAFVRDVLANGLGVRHVVVGYDFRFGHKASGDVQALMTLGERHHYGVTRIDPVNWHGEVCSSSKVRTLIGHGDVARAADFLGHPFAIEGRVVGGDRRGRDLGYPTANIRPPDPRFAKGPALWPLAGVYAVKVSWPDDGQIIEADGAANIGVRPTFDDHQGLLLEVHLLDRQVDLYGKRLCCRFIERLRPETAFADVEALKRQMAKDCEDAKAALAKAQAVTYIRP